MTDKKVVPSILVLESLNAVEVDGKLFSPKLLENLQEYESFEDQMQLDLEIATNDIDRKKAARKLIDLGLLKVAARLQSGLDQDIDVVNEFNEIGESIYGKADVQVVADLAAKELEEFGESADASTLEIYAQLAGEQLSNVKKTETNTRHGAFKDTLLAWYSDMHEIVSGAGEGPYNSEVIRGIFGRVMGAMAVHEEEWLNWTIVNPLDKKMISIVPSKKEVRIPDGRPPTENKDELLGLVFHELGVHVQRSVNGYKIDDEKLARGLPGYIDFEEGLAIFLEHLVTGTIPDKTKDRYIDIALARGDVNGIILSREELIELGQNRAIARDKARNKPHKKPEVLLDAIQTHVNRIFRGGTGAPIRDKQGAILAQPVFNKDLVYYKGFPKAENFIVNQQKAGKSPQHLIDFLLLGKFDATSQEHLDYLKEHHQVAL